MDPLTLGLLGGGMGLLKSELVDRPQADRQRKLAATTAALSPWTGMTPEMPQEANAFGSVMQGGLAGAQLGQSLQKPAAAPAPAAKAPEAVPGTIIPKAGAAQADFFNAQKNKLKQSMYGQPGAEYFSIS
jgi:hypothetical protein